MLLILFTTFFIASSSLLLLYPLSIRLGFVDSPSERKLHEGDIPLIGGLSIFISLAVIFFLFPNILPDSTTYLLCSSILVLIGFIDDKYDLSVAIRMAILISLSIWLVVFAGVGIDNLGNLTGTGVVELNHWSVIFTVFAIIGAVTAFNMVDGLDGLLGGLAGVTLSGLALLFWEDNQLDLMLFCLIFIIAMLPYILFNLGFLVNKKIKVFMGDSGSIFIGFSIIWLLIEGSQVDPSIVNERAIHPVTALWLIAVPLMDMATIMIRRIQKKQSPFKADRGHIHHIFQRIGFSQRQALLMICSGGFVCMAIGVLGEWCGVSEVVMFTSFLVLFSIYFYCFSHIWKITSVIRNSFRR